MVTQIFDPSCYLGTTTVETSVAIMWHRKILAVPVPKALTRSGVKPRRAIGAEFARGSQILATTDAGKGSPCADEAGLPALCRWSEARDRPQGVNGHKIRTGTTTTSRLAMNPLPRCLVPQKSTTEFRWNDAS